MIFLGDAGMARLRALAAEPDIVGDRFELGEPIGEGGMGTVYRAQDRATGGVVALKIVRAVDDHGGARFEREAAALADLSHPGIVRYVAHGLTATGERYLAMELLSGVTLAERFAAGPFDVSEALAVGRGIAAALAAAHAKELVHRDVKPGNVFLEGGSASRVKVLDFGLARGRGGPTVTRAGSLLGTPSYMAPEQVRGARDRRARRRLRAGRAPVQNASPASRPSRARTPRRSSARSCWSSRPRRASSGPRSRPRSRR